MKWKPHGSGSVQAESRGRRWRLSSRALRSSSERVVQTADPRAPRAAPSPEAVGHELSRPVSKVPRDVRDRKRRRGMPEAQWQVWSAGSYHPWGAQLVCA